jgi:hypothetical protein
MMRMVSVESQRAASKAAGAVFGASPRGVGGARRKRTLKRQDAGERDSNQN